MMQRLNCHKESIDFNKAFYKSRYDKGDGEYINCPMTKEEFDAFYDALINAEVVKPHDFEEKFFEGCMPLKKSQEEESRHFFWSNEACRTRKGWSAF